jgi:hypothetical protein
MICVILTNITDIIALHILTGMITVTKKAEEYVEKQVVKRKSSGENKDVTSGI